MPAILLPAPFEPAAVSLPQLPNGWRRRATSWAFSRTLLVTLALLFWGCMHGMAAETGGGHSLALAVEATYLSKFPGFVDWPAESFASADAPIVLCVIGEDPFGDLLERAVDGQKAGGRSFAIRRLTSAASTQGCHILYIGSTDPATGAGLLPTLGGRPILTVTGADDATTKGIINFVVVEGHVRFEIDNEAATRSGLAISSKLLSLAVGGHHS